MFDEVMCGAMWDHPVKRYSMPTNYNISQASLFLSFSAPSLSVICLLYRWKGPSRVLIKIIPV